MPFTIEQFLELFASYNRAVYPFQLLLGALALAAIWLGVKPTAYSGKIISAVLALFWLWTGVVYHLLFFTRINGAAYLFGALCIAEALLLIFYGVVGSEPDFRASLSWLGILGGALIAFSLLIYPLLGFMLGHVYPRLPTFGAPCPTTIFTFGLLLWAERRVPLSLLLIPVVWALIGISAALSLGMWEDFGLVFAALVGTLLLAGAGRLTAGVKSHADEHQIRA